MKKSLVSLLFVMHYCILVSQVSTHTYCAGQEAALIPWTYSNITPILKTRNIVLANKAGLSGPSYTKGGPPYLWGGDHIISMNRYLSRSIEMNNLVMLLQPIECYNRNCPNGDRCTSCTNGTPPRDSVVNCTPPYDQCGSIYCPSKYADCIQMLVNINAQLIFDAANIAYKEQFFHPTLSDYYNNVRQLVRDINAAYDSKDLRRPIIGANIYESVTRANVNVVPIDAIIISNNRQEIIDAGRYTYYFDSNGNPRTTLKFNYVNIALNSSTTAPDSPLDITKLETRLWLYYQCKTFIDFGYTFIHMGIYWQYGDKSNGYDILYTFMNKMRKYATDNNTFVVMNGQNPMVLNNNNSTAQNTSAKWKNTNNFLFDFDGRAMRVREVSQGIKGDGCNEYIGCTDPLSLNYFDNTPCANEALKGVINPLTINSFGGSVAGIGPSGCYYDQIPYMVYFDFGGYDSSFGDIYSCNFNWDNILGVATQGHDSKVWGYDDSSWFTQLDTSCQSYWWSHFYNDRRNYHRGNGFVAAPGILISPTPRGTCRCRGGGYFMAVDNPSLVTAIKTTWEPKLPSISVTELHNPTIYNDCWCDNGSAPSGYTYAHGTKSYRIEVANSDASSTYTIFIMYPNGTWYQYYTIGKTTTFSPPYSGDYTIFLRQDNLGLPSETYGTKMINITTPMESEYCDLLAADECGMYIVQSDTHKNKQSSSNKYIYQIDFNHLNVKSILKIESLNNIKLDSYKEDNSVIHGTFNSSEGEQFLKLNITILDSYNKTITIPFTRKLPYSENNSVKSFDNIQNISLNEINTTKPNQTNNDFIIYPNPAKDEITYRISQNFVSQSNLSIINSLGQTVFKDEKKLDVGESQGTIDISKLVPGVYYLYLEGLKQKYRAKFIKQ